MIRRSVAAALALGLALGACEHEAAPPSAAAPEPVSIERVTIFFGPDSDFIEGIAEETLQRLARSLREHPAETIAIEGYAEAGGAPGFAADLSERRAIAVARVLASYGIAPDRLDVAGRGEVEAVALAIEGRRADVTIRRR